MEAAELERKALRCVHITSGLEECCLAGVNYKELNGGTEWGRAFRLPCTPLNKPGVKKIVCTQFQTAEVEKEESEDILDMESKENNPYITSLHDHDKGIKEAAKRINCICGHNMMAHVGGKKCQRCSCTIWEQN